MKTPFYILIVFSLIVFLKCKNDYSSDKMISSSGKYYFIPRVNRTDKSKDDFANVVISLYSAEGELLSVLNTKAGDSGKWATNWDKNKEIVIIKSSDIGTYAWKIENGEFINVELTESIKEQAEEMLNNKYKSQKKRTS